MRMDFRNQNKMPVLLPLMLRNQESLLVNTRDFFKMAILIF